MQHSSVCFSYFPEFWQSWFWQFLLSLIVPARGTRAWSCLLYHFANITQLLFLKFTTSALCTKLHSHFFSCINWEWHYYMLDSVLGRRRQWQPTLVLLPGKSHGQRSLVGCSPWGCKESDTTERLHFHFSLSCIGEGNGNPPQCSCLENPRDGGAWWAAICGVAQSRTRLERLSSSSSSVLGKIKKNRCNSLANNKE